MPKTVKERNKEFYEANKERERERAKKYYWENKDKIDREAKKAYMAEYLKTYQRRKLTPEEREERNRKRRERYASDPEFREKERQHARDYGQKNPQAKRQSRLRVEFGITQQDYEAMLAKQNGACAICGATENKVKHPRARKFFCVDHDHKTGMVRGLLCHNCNFALGYFRDDPERIRRAADYLDSF